METFNLLLMRLWINDYVHTFRLTLMMSGTLPGHSFVEQNKVFFFKTPFLVRSDPGCGGTLKTSHLVEMLRKSNKQHLSSLTLFSELKKKTAVELFWWSSGWEPALQCKEHWCDLAWEDPTYYGASKPVRHIYWASGLEPTSRNHRAHGPQLLKPRCLDRYSTAREATLMRSPHRSEE